MYMYIWEILRNLCNRNYESLSQKSVEPSAVCAVVIYLFTYLFNRFIPMNCPSWQTKHSVL